MDIKPVFIVADAGDKYLVLMDCRRYSLSDALGGFDAVNNIRNVFALIDKDDYWNNTANYREAEVII